MKPRINAIRQKVRKERSPDGLAETGWLPNLLPCLRQKNGPVVQGKARPMKTVTIVSMWSKLHRDVQPIEYDVLVEEGETVIKTLEKAYYMTNIEGRPFAKQVPATTSGDIMKLDAKTYLVEPHGYHELTDSEVEKIIKQLHCMQTWFGYDSLMQNGLL